MRRDPVKELRKAAAAAEGKRYAVVRADDLADACRATLKGGDAKVATLARSVEGMTPHSTVAVLADDLGHLLGLLSPGE